MGVLAFDTATRATAVALRASDGTVETARDDPEPGRRPGHTPRLMQLIQQLLESAGGWPAVDSIAVGTGPGTFTGLRIGIATALALGRARELPVTGVSTLASLALGADGVAGPFDVILAVLDARRHEVFAAGWQPGALTVAVRAADAGAALPVIAPAAVDPERFAADTTVLGRRLAVGDGALEYREALEAGGIAVAPADSPLHRVDAATHARLASAGLAVTGDGVRPEYLRPPDARPNPHAAGIR